MGLLAAAIRYATVCALLVSIIATTADAEARQYTQREIVDDIIVIGNDALDEGDILSAMATKRNRWYNFLSRQRLKRGALENDARLIRRLYERNGYLGALVETTFIPNVERQGHAIVEVLISEGEQTRFGDVRFHSPDLLFHDRLVKQTRVLRVGAPYDPLVLRRVERGLVEVCANNGRPYASINISAEPGDSARTLDVSFSLDPGSEVHYGESRVEGLRATRESVVLRELTLEPGELYRRTDIVESTQRVYETGLFHVVRIEVPNAEDRPIRPDFVVHCLERPHRFAGGRLEVGQDETYDQLVRLIAEWGHRNLWGTAHRVRLSAETGFRVFSEWDAIEARLQAAYTQPWFLGLRTPATALVYWEPPLKDPTLGYTVEKLGVEFFWNVSPSREVSVVPWIAIDQVNLSDLPRESDPEAFRREQGLTNRVRVGVRCRYDSSDDLFIPTRGYVLAGHLMQTGGFLGGDVDYFEAVASAVRYTPWRGWVIAKRVRLGAQWPVESGYVPRDDRFFLGGAFDVRSYRENRLGPIDAGDNPEGGQAEVLANIEFRHRLFWRFGYSLFADAGQLWPSVDDVGYDRPEAAFGVGLQFVSPAGPLRLDFARRAAPRGHRFHLSILYAF